jgi:uncharacterized protein YjiS (DUF1127 family)
MQSGAEKMSKPLVQGWAFTLHQQDDSSSPAIDWLDTMRIWSSRISERQALAELDDRFLKDIGVSREEAVREAAKPFWQR